MFCTQIFAEEKHLPEIQKSSTLQLSAAFNRTRSKAESFAKKADLPLSRVHESLAELLKDDQVDVIDALLPSKFNLSTVQASIDAGKPIAIEKPIAENLDAAKKIVELSRKTDVPIMVLENWAFFNSIDLIMKIIPRIGNIVSFIQRGTGTYSTANKYITKSTWRLHTESPGEFLSDGGVHQVALFTEILGKVDTISAQATQVRQTSGAEDVIFSTVKLTSGVIGTWIYGSAFGNTEKIAELTIFGDDGSIHLDVSPNHKDHIVTLRIGNSSEDVNTVQETFYVKADAGVKGELENFAEAVKAKDKSLIRVTPEKGFHHFAVIVAGVESSRQGGNAVKVQIP